MSEGSDKVVSLHYSDELFLVAVVHFAERKSHLVRAPSEQSCGGLYGNGIYLAEEGIYEL